jgi:tRNA-specific 2-thiouridylase
MKNFCYGEFDAGAKSCCSVEAIEDARRICAALGISHRVIDVEELFTAEVIDVFFEEYRAARTPNPCVRCNSAVRFGTLADLARRYGAQHVATGHYARIFRTPAGAHFLGRAAQREKDQSYFLASLPRPLLPRVLFPLGELDKPRVRALAAQAALPVAEKEESQEVCFIPDGDLKTFLAGRIESRPGPIVTVRGEVVGTHEGLHAYTIGQRRKLGIAAGEPRYVVSLDTARNALVVGTKEDVYGYGCACSIIWIDEEQAGVGAGSLSAQIRSRHAAAPVERLRFDGARCEVRFAEAQKSITPGQAIVFYRDDIVVGAGTIDEAIA